MIPRGEAQAGHGRRITNPDRVMEAESGLTKGELADYHRAVAARLMPHAVRRPLSLVRCPRGAEQPCFFQKQASPGFGPSVRRRTLAGNPTLHVLDAGGILELVQFNAVELHAWGSRLPAWTRPDQLVLDFDPDPDLGFDAVIEAALECRELLRESKLESFPKTTGGKGLHVVVPLAPSAGWTEVKAFARELAEEMVRRRPERYLAQASKAQRRGRVFIDWLRNARGATAVLPYSPRVRAGATVATPLRWDAVAPGLDPRDFTVRSVPALLSRADPWAGFFELEQRLGRRRLA